MGFDRNINTNDKIWRDIGQGYLPLSSSIEGSLMMRPIFSSARDSILLGVNETEAFQFSSYPNPANERLIIECDSPSLVFVELLSIDGRRIYNEAMNTRMELSTGDLTEGMYILRLHEENGSTQTRKIMIRH